MVLTAQPTVAHARGSYFQLADGTRVLDGCSGAINVNLGHAHPRVLETLAKVPGSVHFAYRAQATSRPLEQLRDRLLATAGDEYSHVLFTSSGSEAIEQAIRVVWRYWFRQGHRDRDRLITETPSYHGMTGTALKASGHPLRQAAIGPAANAMGPHVLHVRGETPDRATGPQWRDVLAAHGPRTQAVIVETVTGASGGAGVATTEALGQLRQAAAAHDVPVVADEVMTSFGRLGTALSSVDRGLSPDLIAVSKGLGAGYFPIGAVIVKSRIAEALGDRGDLGTFGHTMGGSPLGAAVANAVLDVLEDECVYERVCHDSAAVRLQLERAVEGSDVLGPPRGDGFIWGLPLTTRPGDPPGGGWQHRQAELLRDAWDHGLALYPAGVDEDSASLVVSPPLNCSSQELQELADKVSALATLTPEGQS